MNHPLRNLPARLVLLLLAAALPACSVLPKQAPASTYQLPLQPEARTAAQVPRSDSPLLVIHTPTANRVLDSDRVIIAQPDGRLSAWEGMRWADSVPVLLRDHLAEAFTRDGRVIVSVESGIPAAHMELIGALRAFQFEQRDNMPVVSIRMDVRLINSRYPGVAATRRFDIVRSAATKRDADVIAAFGVASDSMSKQIVDWVLQQRGAAASTSNPDRTRPEALQDQAR